MKLDLHVHCKPVSLCAHHPPEELPAHFQKAGMDGFVLTNHCYPAHCEPLCPGDPAGQAQAYRETYRRCKAAGDAIGVKVFFGAELKLINEPHQPEFLLYGISEEDFLASYPLWDKSQAELFAFCEAHDILMVQAHPYRTGQGYEPADMRYLHGVEIYNPHPHFDPRVADCVALADAHGKTVRTAGTDFHVGPQAGGAGVIVPDTVADQFALRDFLRTGQITVFDRDGIVYEARKV